MKRKIEAKMKNRTGSSNAMFAQELAVSIIDKTAETSEQTPMAPNPEAAREAWTSATNSLGNNLPIPMPNNSKPSPTPEPKSISTPIPDSPEKALTLLPPPLALFDIPTLAPPPPEGVRKGASIGEFDEEGGLLAQLAAERVAEEKAREKRRKLEERLAVARRKMPQRPVQKREGQEQISQALQDSTSSLIE
jgi:hypothetical protein